MILGIGSDIVDISRIESSLARFGRRFENRIFTKREQDYARRGNNPTTQIIASTYAKRFAAKEACYKALGACRSSNISWLDIEVVNNKNGAPEINLSAAVSRQLQKITPEGMNFKIFLSLSDDYPYAQAYVIIDSFPITSSD